MEKGRTRIINYRLTADDYKDLYNTIVKEFVTEPVIVNGQVSYQCKVVTRNVQDSLKDLKVSDFAMANALVSGIAANFKPVSYSSNDVDSVIDSVNQLEMSFDNLTTNGEG